MIFTSATLLSFSLLASQVAAHGYVEWVFANGRNYTGDNVDDPQGSKYLWPPALALVAKSRFSSNPDSHSQWKRARHGRD